MPYLLAPDFETRMAALAASAPTLCTVTAFPNPTASEGLPPRTYSFMKIGHGGGARPSVLAVGGMHARELAQPDSVISFAERLVLAYNGSSAFVIPAYTDAGGSTFGPVTMPGATVRRLVDTIDIFLVPLANPDGRAYNQSTDPNWRKNRAPRVVAANPATAGVDINRNFDIAWDFNVYYSAAMVASGGVGASTDPADPQQSYNGAASGGVASQPEVRNLIWLLENRPITYVVDLHAYSKLVMYPWAIEHNGSNASQTFLNAAFDHNRDGNLGTVYNEFFPNAAPTRILDRHATVAGSIRDGIAAATGRTYTVGPVFDIIYPAPGSLTDYAFSRQFRTPGSPPIYSFALEFGDIADTFQPIYTDPNGFPKLEREIHAALLRFVEAALPASPAPNASSSSCSFTLAVAGLAAGSVWLEDIRAARDLARSRPRLAWIVSTTEAAYRTVSRALAPLLRRAPWARAAVAQLVVRPTAAVSAMANARARR